MYYRGAQAAIVVYDITKQDSFARAKTWVKELQRQVNWPFVLSRLDHTKILVFTGSPKYCNRISW